MKVTTEDWNGVWASKGVLHRMLNYMRGLFTVSLYNNVFKEHIDKKTKLLEVGCGSSTTSLYLAPMLKEYIGLDLSPEALKISKNKAKLLNVKNASFVKGDCFKMPFKKNSFDVVWSQGLLEHFDHPKKILDEKIRVAKKGGVIVTSVPAYWSYHKLWYTLTRPKLLRGFWPWTDQTFYTKKRLNKLANKGVKLDRIFYYAKYGVIVQILRKK